jgi:hypothetical protein
VRFLRNTALWILLLPYAATFAGIASNQLVLNANDDTFPVRINLVKLHKWADDGVAMSDGRVYLDETHVVMSNKTHLNWLADVFDFHQDIESVGDLLLDLGGWLSTFCPFVWMAFTVDKLRRLV